MLHVGVADNSDLHCSLAIFTWLSLRHNVTTCISEKTVMSTLFLMYISSVLLLADCPLVEYLGPGKQKKARLHP